MIVLVASTFGVYSNQHNGSRSDESGTSDGEHAFKESFEDSEKPFEDSSPEIASPVDLGLSDEDSGNIGFLEMFMIDGPLDDVQALIVRLESIEVHSEGGGWYTYSDVPMEMDVLELQDGVMQSLGLEELPPGHYTQIRLMLGDVMVMVDNRTEEVKVPSGKQTGIKLTDGFDVVQGNITRLTLDFDVMKSLHYAPGNGWILRPTVKLIAAMVEPIIRIKPVQMLALQRLEANSLEPMQVRFGQTFGVPEFLEGLWPTNPYVPDLGAKAVDFLESYSDLFGLNLSHDSFNVTSIKDSELGFFNVKLQQVYEGIPVWGAQQTIHMDPGNVSSFHGTIVSGVEVGTSYLLDQMHAEAIAKTNILRKRSTSEFVKVERPYTAIYNPAIFDRFLEEGEDSIAWFLKIRTIKPGGLWYYFVDAMTGEILESWDGVGRVHPSFVFDAKNTETLDDDVLWYAPNYKKDGTPPQDVENIYEYSGNYYEYLLNTFGVNSIDGKGMALIGRANDPEAGLAGGAACFDAREDEASFAPGQTTQDTVAHEFTHGLQKHWGVDLVYERQPGAIKESVADMFGDLLDCQTSCEWNDTTPDHIEDYKYYAGGCDEENDNCGVHENDGILNRLFRLVTEGGTHRGYNIVGLGVAKAEQLLYFTSMKSGLTETATFYEYRDVMIRTCKAMANIGFAGMTFSDCHEVFIAWCSIGLCFLTQNVAGALNEDFDRFGYTLASGDFNGDSYDDLAVGVPYEDIGGKSNTGNVIVFYGTSFGLNPTGAEFISQTPAGKSNEAGDKFGWSLSVGNFNGDSYDDLAIGIPYENFGSNVDVGQVIVFYGNVYGLRTAAGASTTETLTQSHVSASNEEYDKFGYSLCTGNFNGDGYDDLAVGVPYEDVGSSDDAGVVNVFFGATHGLLTSSDVANWERVKQEDAGVSSEDDDLFGWSLAAGDFNGDSYDDLAVGVPEEDIEDDGYDDTGIVIVFYGKAGGFFSGGIIWERLRQELAGGDTEDNDNFGWSLAAGNFDGDSYDDLAIGIPEEDIGYIRDAGAVFVFYGADYGLWEFISLIPPQILVRAERLTQDDVPPTEPEDWDGFGYSMTVANLNNDQYDELVVGIPYEDSAGEIDNGMVLVFYGSSTSLESSAKGMITEIDVGGKREDLDLFGFSLAAGDFNNNDRCSLVISSPLEDFKHDIIDVGAVYFKDY